MSAKTKKVSLILLAWLIAGILYSVQSYYYRTQIGQQVDGLLIFLIDTPYFLIWALFTPVPLYYFKRIPFAKSNLLRFILLHISLALIVAFIHAFIYNTYRLFINDSTFSLNQAYINAVANFDYGLLVYFIVVLIIGVNDYYLRYQQAHSALIQSQLDTVRMKLQPHFLFNTLNSIAVLIKENPEQAGDTVKSLGDLLRHVLKNMENQFTELQKEIKFLKKYLSIEQIRFGSRLQIKIDYNNQLNKILIPSLILQPLVENAIQHGIAKHRGKGYVTILINKENNVLRLIVRNNGSLTTTNLDSGLGLHITKDRLKSLYGSDYKLSLTEISQGVTEALLEIPLIEESAK